VSRIWTFLTELARNIFRAPGRFAQLSVPMIAAVLSVFLLLSVLLIVILIPYFDESGRLAEWAWSSMGVGRRIGIIVCMIVTPFVVHYAVRLWLEGDISRFPDIDYAWKRGLAEMERAGLDITMAPIIVVLGCRDTRDARALADDPRQGFRVRGVPEDQGSGVAMQWYAGKRAIVLALTFVGQLCELAQLSDGATDAHAAEDDEPSVLTESGRTMMIGDPRAATPRPVRPQVSREGTAMIEGTMFLPTGEGSKTAFIAISQPGAIEKAAARMTSDSAAEQQLRLRYLCRLLRNIRRPYCPVNGIIALTPYPHLLREADSQALETALRGDLDVAFQVLAVRCPTAVLVTGMDLDRGFEELCRRVGEERTAKQRFGKGFELWRPQSDENMHTAVRQACAAFEDWTYKLFREPGALEQPGNRDLFALVCRMRGRVQQHLMHLLEGCFARTAGEESRLLFLGCYFSTLGARPAFASSLIEKLVDEQDQLEWTNQALRSDARYRLWSKLVMALAVVFLAMVAAATWYFSSSGATPSRGRTGASQATVKTMASTALSESSVKNRQ